MQTQAQAQAQSLLDSMDFTPPDSADEVVQVRFRTMSDAEFSELQKQIQTVIRPKLLAQEELTLDEEMQINAWYRERRGQVMSVVTEKPAKAAKPKAEKTAKATPARRAKSAVKVKTEAEIDAIFADLFTE